MPKLPLLVLALISLVLQGDTGQPNDSTVTLLNDWQVNGILTLQTGLPFTIIDSPNLAIIQRVNFANPTFDPNNPFGNTPRNFLYGRAEESRPVPGHE